MNKKKRGRGRKKSIRNEKINNAHSWAGAPQEGHDIYEIRETCMHIERCFRKIKRPK